MPTEANLDYRVRVAHRERISRNLPILGWVVTGAGLLWFTFATLLAASSLHALAALELQLAVLVSQGVVFGLASLACRRDPRAPRVTVLAVAACVVVGLGWIWILTTTATVPAMLVFATFALFGAAPLVLAWGLTPQLVFQTALTCVWVVAAPMLPRHLPLTEIGFAVGFGNLFALVASQWAASVFRAETGARLAALELDRQLTASRDAYRALAENAVDYIWAIDLAGRWTYVNGALARRCGRRVDEMTGRPVGEILCPNPEHPDPATLITRMVRGEDVPPQVFEMATPDGSCWVEAIATLILGPGGEVVGIQGSSRDVTDRRRAEEALRASEERFRSIFDNAPVGMAVVAPDGTSVQVNQEHAAMLGYAPAELAGVRVWDYLHPDDVPVVRALVASAVDGERESFSVECRQRHRDGRIVWNAIHARLERHGDGRPCRFIAQVEDITDKRAAEAALRGSEQRFRRFADSLAAGVLISGRDGIVYANDAASAISGYARDELLGMQVWDLVDTTARDDARSRATARLAGAELSGIPTYRLATKSGEPRWVEISVAMLELDGERMMLGAAFDVTERILAEQALRASEARYRGLVESQREMVVRFGVDGALTFANDAYCATYGVRCETAIGRGFVHLVHPEDLPSLDAAVAGAMEAPYRGHVELRSRTVHGWRWIEWEGSAIRDAAGAIVEIQAAGRDVTDRRRAQDDLRASLADLRRSEERLRLLAQRQVAVREEERKRLSFALHDDVCQELVGVRILIDSVMDRVVSAPDAAMNDLGRANRYLREVVDHLRVLARDLRPLLLRDFGLESSLRSLATGLSTPATSVRAEFPIPVPRLDDTVEMTVYRIAQEAVMNALRHADARTVTVTLAVDEAQLDLVVLDDGRGFDPATETPHACGLASMQERALTLAGRLRVESRLGEGTSVRLGCPLPLRSSTPPSSATAA